MNRCSYSTPYCEPRNLRDFKRFFCYWPRCNAALRRRSERRPRCCRLAYHVRTSCLTLSVILPPQIKGEQPTNKLLRRLLRSWHRHHALKRRYQNIYPPLDTQAIMMTANPSTIFCCLLSRPSASLLIKKLNPPLMRLICHRVIVFPTMYLAFLLH